MGEKKNEKMNFYLDNYPLKELFFMDLSKNLWEKFNPHEPLFSKKNYGLMYELSERIKKLFLSEKNDDTIKNEIDKLKWITISSWDFFKDSPPKFGILLLSQIDNDNKLFFINPFEKKSEDCYIYRLENPEIWVQDSWHWAKEAKNIYSLYGRWINEFNKNRKIEIHFWDFLHSFKRFIWPFVITRKLYSGSLEEFSKDLVKIIINKETNYEQGISTTIDNNRLWEWKFFKDIVDKTDIPKDVFEKILRQYYEKLGEGVGAKYIYEFPIMLNTEEIQKKFFFQSVATVSLGTLEPINYAFWEYLIYSLVKSYLQIFLPSSFISRFKVNSLKSAIASIMSRNMSHNIGSHILSSLGREGINAADDRILFQYLQQRMDYIAQISTEMPTWSSSVWFLSDLMKRFYMQTHLLEYIGKSEGLGAKNWNETQDKGKIVIKIKIKDKNDPDGKYIISDKPHELSSNMNDFQLAIPGGIVGLHAFYTILENIIRNSAKHNWNKDSPGNPDNLKITIEFENNTEKEFVTFTIFDNVSDNNVKCENENNEKSNGKCKNTVEHLHDKMNNIFSSDFINESGKLKKENWGLAEMRISAGYLNLKDYQDIGFHKVNTHNNRKQNEASIIEAIPQKQNGKDRLAYRFEVPKPKELLIIGDPDLKKEHEDILKKSSIYVEGELEDRPYEHEIIVIFNDAFNGQYDCLERMPGRIIIVKKSDKPNDLIQKISKDLSIEKKSIIERKIVILEQLKYNGMKNDLTSDNDTGKEKREEFKIELYKTWVGNLINKKEFFYLNLEGNKEPGSKISDYLEEQMYRLIRNHVVDTNSLKENCNYLSDNDIENIRNKFKDKKFRIDKFISVNGINVLEDDTRNNAVKNVLKSKINILRDLIFRVDDKINTVPERLNISKQNGDICSSWIDVFGSLFHKSDCKIQMVDKKEKKKATICYERHKGNKRDDNQQNKDAYVESLSGSQFYFTMLYDSLTSRKHTDIHRKKKIILQLIENALLKCVIIDERAARFLSSSKSLREKFEFLRIHAPFRVHFSGKKEVPLTENSSTELKKFSEKHLDGWDIFIIHQGVLDRMGLDTKEKAREFLAEIKRSVPFVFVTSGRGKPDNVPNNVKFLPFSSIDSFLLKEYPEKILLIQSAMKLNLPKNGEPV
jgi:hypothetical protein